MELPTVKIVSDAPESGGCVLINESDFDPAIHTKYVETAEDTEKDDLVALGVFYKLGAPSTLGRWSLDRLRTEVGAAKSAAEASPPNLV